MTPFLQDSDFTLCACGCGGQVRSPDKKGRPRRFLRGHNLRVDHPVHRPGAKPSFLGRRHRAETRAKIAEAASRPKPWIRGSRNGMYGRTGSLNPNYKDGSSPERQRLYASGEGKALIRSSCGAPKRGPRSLHVHHVKSWGEYPELRFEPSNVTTLCRDCHHEAHRKEVEPCEGSPI